RLRFTMPDTSISAPPNGLAGPAEIVVSNGPTEIAHIGPLFQPHDIGSSCDKEPETVFQQFTVLPLPNPYGAIVDALGHNQAVQALATLDGSGSLLVPIDWQSVLPFGPGAPVARLLDATFAVAAFKNMPSVHINVSADDVRSFTLDGKP